MPTLTTPLRRPQTTPPRVGEVRVGNNGPMTPQTLTQARAAVSEAQLVYEQAEAESNRAMRHLLTVHPTFPRAAFRRDAGGSLAFLYSLMHRNAPAERDSSPLFGASESDRDAAYDAAVEAVRRRLDAWRALDEARAARVEALVDARQAAPSVPVTELARQAGMSYQVTRKTLAKHR